MLLSLVDQESAPNDNYSLNGSIGAPRTPRGECESLREQIWNTPLKALSDAFKRVQNEICGDQNKTLVFISPSKRKPKRASLIKVDTRSPLRSIYQG